MSFDLEIPDGLERTAEGIYVVKDDSHLSKWVRDEHHRLDIAEGQIEFYKRFIPVGGTVVDAGASLGDHTLTYAKLVGPSGRVLAFEPHPLTFQALKFNFDRWSNVICVNMGLSDRVGSLSFTREENIGASHCSNEGEKIGVTVIDAYFDSFMSCDLIHLDVEGFETRAIMGARETIAKFKPAIVLEVNHSCLARYGLTEADVRLLLDDINYRWEELEPHHGPHLPQRDILALPK